MTNISCIQFDMIFAPREGNQIKPNKSIEVGSFDFRVDKEVLKQIPSQEIILSVNSGGGDYTSLITFKGENDEEQVYNLGLASKQSNFNIRYADIGVSDDDRGTYEDKIGWANICAGDFNESVGAARQAIVDSADASIFLTYLDSLRNVPIVGDVYEYDPQKNFNPDLNGSGRVNTEDLAILASNYGEKECRTTLADARDR